MSEQIKITISGDDAKLLAVWQRQNAEILKNQKALIRMGEAAEKAGDQVGGAMDSAKESTDDFADSLMNAIGSKTSGLLGVAAAIALVTKEFDEMIKRQKDAANQQISEAQAERKALMNLGNDSGMTPDEFKKRVTEIAQRTGASRKDILMAASSAFSARGNLTPQQSLESVEEGALFNPDDPAAMETMSGANMDLRRRGKATAKQGSGLQIALQGASRVKSLEFLSRNGIPAVNAMQNFGDTPEEAGEMFAAMSQALSDAEGAIAKTASIQLTQQIYEATKDLPQLKNTNQRIAYLNSAEGSGRLRKMMGHGKKEGTLHGEAQALQSMRGFLTPGSTEQGLLAAAQRAVPSLEQAEGERDKMLEMLNRQPLQQVAGLDRDLNALTEQKRSSDRQAAEAAITAEGRDKLLAAHGVPWIDRKILGTKAFVRKNVAGEDPATVERDVFEESAGEMERASKEVWQGAPEVKDDLMKAAEVFRGAADKLARYAESRGKQEIVVEVREDGRGRAKAGPGVANDRNSQ